MLSLPDPSDRRIDPISRREWLRIGGTALGGLSLAGMANRSNSLAASPIPSFGRAKSVIVFGLLGGPAQHETWDPKPNASKEIRGEFGSISTRTPGLLVGELMPRTALLTDRIAVLRAMVTNDNAHSSSGYQMLTGIPHAPMGVENATPKPPNVAPSMGALARYLVPDRGGLPSAVTLPEHLWNDGGINWPGQDAGELGHRYDPWLIHCDPSEETFKVPGLTLPENLSHPRLQDRRSLLDRMNSTFNTIASSGSIEQLNQHGQRAFDLLTSGRSRKAFDLNLEAPTVRDRYGRSRFAQSILLARRLVEAGVSLVQVNWTRIKDQPNGGGWDTHAKHNEASKNLLMPIMDQAYSALIEDLDARGLLDETLVVWFGEFGRTPRFNPAGGRDHWGRVFSLALAGGGIRGGGVHGASDRNGADPLDGVVAPRDLIATIFHCLGFAPNTEIRDQLGRPIPLSRGRVVEQIL